MESGTLLLLRDSSNTGTIDVGAHSQLYAANGLSDGGSVTMYGAGSLATMQS